MMERIAGGVALLLVVGLGGTGVLLQDATMALAAVAIGCLAEAGLALRARRNRSHADAPAGCFVASSLSFAEEEGSVRVALLEEPRPGRAAARLALWRTVQHTHPAGTAAVDHPGFSLSGREWTGAGGIADACLTPRMLRLTLHPASAAALGTQQVCVEFAEIHDARRLERALRRVLRGIPFVSERSVPEEAAEPSPGVTV